MGHGSSKSICLHAWCDTTRYLILMITVISTAAIMCTIYLLIDFETIGSVWETILRLTWSCGVRVNSRQLEVRHCNLKRLTNRRKDRLGVLELVHYRRGRVTNSLIPLRQKFSIANNCYASLTITRSITWERYLLPRNAQASIASYNHVKEVEQIIIVVSVNTSKLKKYS